MCSAHSQLCQTLSKICISSCMDISVARKVSLAAFPVLVSSLNLARFWIFGFSFGFVSCKPHGESACRGHCFHFLSHIEPVTSHLKSTINTNCTCQIFNGVMTNWRFAWQNHRASWLLSICSHLNYKRTLIQLSLLVTNFILCKPCSMSAALLLPAPSCPEKWPVWAPVPPFLIMSHFSLFRLFAFFITSLNSISIISLSRWAVHPLIYFVELPQWS